MFQGLRTTFKISRVRRTDTFQAGYSTISQIVQIAFSVRSEYFNIFYSIARTMRRRPATCKAVNTNVANFTNTRRFVLPNFHRYCTKYGARYHYHNTYRATDTSLGRLPSTSLRKLLLISALSHPVCVHLLHIRKIKIVFLYKENHGNPRLTRFPSVRRKFMTRCRGINIYILV